MERKGIILVSLDKLTFDPENPRLPEKLRGPNKDKKVLEWMLEKENVLELMGSISEKGYFPAEPLFVVEREKKSGYYEVVEGNRRLAAVKLLDHPGLATIRNTSVQELAQNARDKNNLDSELPVMVFDNKDAIQVYLGYRHITGVKEWDAIAKARYLEKLRNLLGLSNKKEQYKTLAKIIGSNPSYVKSILNGLRVFNVIQDHDYFDIKGLDETTLEFGVLYTATGKKNISVFVGIDLEASDPTKHVKIKHLEELTRWMFEKNSENHTRLGESRNLPDLDQIVANATALKAFRNNKSIDEAILYTGKPVELFYKTVSRALESLKIARDQLHNIEKTEKRQLDEIDEVIRLSKDIHTTLASKKNA